MKNKTDFLEFGSVRISDGFVSQMSGKQTIIRIPRTDITSIELTKRAGAERPFAHIVCGILLLSVGGIGIEMLYTMIAVDGEFVPFRVMGLLLLIPVGLWLIISALSKKKMLSSL